MPHTQQENEPALPIPVSAQDHPCVQIRDRIQELHEATAAKISNGVPANTRRAYTADRADWRAFCVQMDIEPLPVRDDVLAWYVTELLEHGSTSLPEHRRRPLAASTVELRLSAVATMAQEHGAGRGSPAPTAQARLQGYASVCKGARAAVLVERTHEHLGHDLAPRTRRSYASKPEWSRDLP